MEFYKYRKMKHKMKELDQNIEIIFTDSKDYSCTKNEWLQGGAMIVV